MIKFKYNFTIKHTTALSKVDDTHKYRLNVMWRYFTVTDKSQNGNNGIISCCGENARTSRMKTKKVALGYC